MRTYEENQMFKKMNINFGQTSAKLSKFLKKDQIADLILHDVRTYIWVTI